MKDLAAQAEKYCECAMAIPLDHDDRLLWQNNFNGWPVMRHLGTHLDLTHSRMARLTLDHLQPFHLGGAGNASTGGGQAINGAILAGMFDAALGVAGVLQLLGRRAATVDLSIKMFRPLMGSAHAFGWAVRRGGSVVFTEAILLNEHGVRCAQATGIVCTAEGPGPAGYRTPPLGVSEACLSW